MKTATVSIVAMLLLSAGGAYASQRSTDNAGQRHVVMTFRYHLEQIPAGTPRAYVYTSCPDGQVAVAGGFLVTAGSPTVVASRSSGPNEWVTVVDNSASGDSSVSTMAHCFSGVEVVYDDRGNR